MKAMDRQYLRKNKIIILIKYTLTALHIHFSTHLERRSKSPAQKSHIEPCCKPLRFFSACSLEHCSRYILYSKVLLVILNQENGNGLILMKVTLLPWCWSSCWSRWLKKVDFFVFLFSAYIKYIFILSMSTNERGQSKKIIFCIHNILFN